jgi:hypothetical protein
MLLAKMRSRWGPCTRSSWLLRQGSICIILSSTNLRSTLHRVAMAVVTVVNLDLLQGLNPCANCATRLATRCNGAGKCFDRNFIDEEKTTNITKGPKYNVDPAWYSDTGATDHITSELDKLAVREKYNGQEQIHAANDGGMHIAHVGHSTLYTPSRNLALKNILHVPSSQRNLIFIHHFTRDNHVFIEYHPYVFLVKDSFMRKVLLHGKCRGGLYPFPSLEQSTTKCALSVVKPSNRRCHERLGHPSLVVFQRVLGDNKLAYSRDPHPEAVCD